MLIGAKHKIFNVRNESNMCIQKVIIGLLLAVAITGCGLNDKKIVSEKYPSIRWGFTTQNFINTTPVSVDNANALIAYARAEGYDWIELRDPEASLTVSQCQKIASFARDNQIEIIYSIQRGLLDDHFWDIFKRGIANAAVFNEPGFFRALSTGKEYQIDSTKIGWTKEEFVRAVAVANEAAALACQYGIRFVIENGDGDIDGYGKSYYGLADLFDQTDPHLLFQFDTANFFWVPKISITAEKAEAFLRRYASRMAYIHLKSAKDGQALPILADNPLNYDAVFSIMEENNVYYVAIELDAITDLHQIYKNHKASLQYLVQNNFISIK